MSGSLLQWSFPNMFTNKKSCRLRTIESSPKCNLENRLHSGLKSDDPEEAMFRHRIVPYWTSVHSKLSSTTRLIPSLPLGCFHSSVNISYLRNNKWQTFCLWGKISDWTESIYLHAGRIKSARPRLKCPRRNLAQALGQCVCCYFKFIQLESQAKWIELCGWFEYYLGRECKEINKS